MFSVRVFVIFVSLAFLQCIHSAYEKKITEKHQEQIKDPGVLPGPGIANDEDDSTDADSVDDPPIENPQFDVSVYLTLDPEFSEPQDDKQVEHQQPLYRELFPAVFSEPQEDNQIDLQQPPNRELFPAGVNLESFPPKEEPKEVRNWMTRPGQLYRRVVEPVEHLQVLPQTGKADTTEETNDNEKNGKKKQKIQENQKTNDSDPEEKTE